MNEALGLLEELLEKLYHEDTVMNLTNADKIERELNSSSELITIYHNTEENIEYDLLIGFNRLDFVIEYRVELLSLNKQISLINRLSPNDVDAIAIIRVEEKSFIQYFKELLNQ